MGRQEQTNHLFSNRDLRILLVPLIVEQILNSLMGTADSIMVSNVGSAAISAVSLVDSINILVIQAFYALAAGGTIVCSQYIGQKDKKNDEKNNRFKVDRSCTGDSGNSPDDIWNLPGRSGCSLYKSNQYLYGVYWNWIIKK